MRSLIIVLVEHGEDTDGLDALMDQMGIDDNYPDERIIDYTVRVDVPSCFVLDSGSTD